MAPDICKDNFIVLDFGPTFSTSRGENFTRTIQDDSQSLLHFPGSCSIPRLEVVVVIVFRHEQRPVQTSSKQYQKKIPSLLCGAGGAPIFERPRFLDVVDMGRFVKTC